MCGKWKFKLQNVFNVEKARGKNHISKLNQQKFP